MLVGDKYAIVKEYTAGTGMGCRCVVVPVAGRGKEQQVRWAMCMRWR